MQVSVVDLKMCSLENFLRKCEDTTLLHSWVELSAPSGIKAQELFQESECFSGKIYARKASIYDRKCLENE